jgi:hypothetical protein
VATARGGVAAGGGGVAAALEREVSGGTGVVFVTGDGTETIVPGCPGAS